MKVLGRWGMRASAAGLLLLLVLWVILAPSEANLGNLIKLVYVHAALVWVGLVVFALAGILGLLALTLRRPIWYDGTQAAATAALVLWLAYALTAVIVTGLTWGQWIAWAEPRVRVTALILIASITLWIVTRLLQNGDFTALANVLLGIATWIVVRQAEAIRHPVNPIGGSGSTAIQIYAILIILTVGGLAALLALWLWTRQYQIGPDRASGTKGRNGRRLA